MLARDNERVIQVNCTQCETETSTTVVQRYYHQNPEAGCWLSATITPPAAAADLASLFPARRVNRRFETAAVRLLSARRAPDGKQQQLLFLAAAAARNQETAHRSTAWSATITQR